MNYSEYCEVRNLTYIEYCDYLQDKYGIGLDDYMTPKFNKKKKCTRTNEGLFAHHKDEDKMIMLSTKEFAELCPYEWQLKENIVYCDYLEHLLLHVLICIYPSDEAVPGFDVGYGGVVNYLVPELNDIYSGWVPKQEWRLNCYDLINNDYDVYLAILEDFIYFEKGIKRLNKKDLLKSFNEPYRIWKNRYNRAVYKDIKKLYRKY